MKFIRSHISGINLLATSGFMLFWLLMAIVLPLQIKSMTESYSIISIYNAEEGCFELIVKHHQEADAFPLLDENNDMHSFHNSCCFNDLALTFKEYEVDEDLPLAYLKEQAEVTLFSELFLNPENLQEKPIPPPVSFYELRIIRLLI